MAEFINALRQGMADQTDWQQTDTRRKAGKSFAAGDYGAASGILAGEGMLPEAAQMRGYGQQEQAGQDEAARKEMKDRAEWMLNGVNGLMSVPEAQRGQVFDQHLVPTLQAMGMPTEVIAKLRASPKDDATLRAFAASLGQEAAKFTGVGLGNGGYGAFNPSTGKMTILREPTAKQERMRGPDGIYERNMDGEWERVESFGPAPRQPSRPRAPSGGGGSRPAASGGGLQAMTDEQLAAAIAAAGGR